MWSKHIISSRGIISDEMMMVMTQQVLCALRSDMIYIYSISQYHWPEALSAQCDLISFQCCCFCKHITHDFHCTNCLVGSFKIFHCFQFRLTVYKTHKQSLTLRHNSIREENTDFLGKQADVIIRLSKTTVKARVKTTAEVVPIQLSSISLRRSCRWMLTLCRPDLEKTSLLLQTKQNHH